MNGDLFKKALIGASWPVTLVRGSILALVIFVVCKFIYMPVWTSGKSMEPTVASGKLLFVNALVYRYQKPQRGDIVTIKMAGKAVTLLKRVIGLPGETVRIENGLVYINGVLLDESYLLQRGNWSLRDQKVAEDEYFVIGDNRSIPMNSHVFGKIKKSRIIGRY